MTEYVILKKEEGCTDLGVGSEPVWWQADYEGTFMASSARRALALANVGEGEYVAIPARSWKPLTVKVTQTTKVTIA